MKKTKIISLLLSLTLLVGVANPAALAIEARAADGTTSGSGMEISKTAVYNAATDDYTITLEAYATGSKVISTEKKDIPTDIVLVLDQSGSMRRCIVCGDEIGYNDYHTEYTYTEATNVSNDSRTAYYVKVGSTYIEVYYCNGTHDGWFDSTTHCSGGAGWYTSWNSTDHTTENKYIPNTQDATEGVPFYTRGSAQYEACTSRLDALKSSVTNFIHSVAEKASTTGVDHRVAVVGFASTGGGNSYRNTELLSTSSVVNYGSASPANYKDALVSVLGTDGKVNNRLTTAVSRLADAGDTYLQHGMDMANNVFAQYPVNPNERQRVVIVFTDGYPAPSGSDTFNYTMANAAINNAYTTKNTYNATVYTVAVLDGADPTASIENGYSYNGISDAQQKVASNRYLHYVSSNYISANSMSNGGSLNPKASPFTGGDSYYLSAGDTASLNSIFQQISNNIESGGSSTTLSSETVIKDIIADQFELPAGATADDITLETYVCNDKNGDTYTWTKNDGTMGATATVSGDQVSVTGFDFAENYVGPVTNNGSVTYRGHKLVIKFNVKVKDGFLGGNDVYTNASAGVYENSSATEPVLTFNRPQVNVAIKDVTVTAADKNVYLLSNLTANQIKDGATVKCGDVALDLSRENYGLQDWQTEYVDITVEIKDKDGNTVTDLNDLSEDTTYSVSAKVSPKTTNPTSDQGTKAVEKTGKASAAINVFKPELTYKDSSVYYGDTAPTDYSSNLTSTKWKHGTTEGSSETMTGENPTLYMTYTPETHKIQDGKINTKEDVAVDVAVKIGTTDVTDKTTFVHTKCDANCTDPVNGKFWLHVKTCQLTITKTGGAGNESYVFTVYKDGVKYSEVSIYGNNSETIYELPVGSYTIEEESGWSWRWTANNGSTATLSKDVTSGTITCTNSSNGKNYWLNGFSEIIKNIIRKK